jgi:hypothetical protein
VPHSTRGRHCLPLPVCMAMCVMQGRCEGRVTTKKIVITTPSMAGSRIMTRVNSLVNGPPDVSEVHGHRYECSSAPWYRYNQFAQGPGAHHRHEGIFGQNLQQPFPGRFPLTFPAATSTPPCEARAPAETRAQNCARRPTTQRVWGGRGCQYCTNDCLGLYLSLLPAPGAILHETMCP